jgi:hypothetical protein
MSSVIRRWVVVFAAVQLAGLICAWRWPLSPVAGRLLWDTAFITLFPGNILSAVLIEKLLWSSNWSTTGMSLVEIPVLVAINAAVWFCAINIIRRLLRKCQA